VGTSIRLTHSTSEITAGYLDNVELGGSEFDVEIVDDHYTVYLIQRQSKLRVASGEDTGSYSCCFRVIGEQPRSRTDRRPRIKR